MPVEFISATHTTPTTEATAGGRKSGFDVDYTRRAQFVVSNCAPDAAETVVVVMTPEGE